MINSPSVFVQVELCVFLNLFYVSFSNPMVVYPGIQLVGKE